MCTGEPGESGRSRIDGFTLLELLLGVLLTALLALGTGPLVISIQEIGVREADRTVGVLQGRVAAERLERDLRTATAAGCPFGIQAPVMQATRSQVVFLGRRPGEDGLTLFEWEIVGGKLMRRWRSCPSEMPTSLAHSSFVDNKTMLEGLASDAWFTYSVDGVPVEGDVAEADLSRISSVALMAGGFDAEGAWGVLVKCSSRVGR